MQPPETEPATPDNYDERSYLVANPDVAQAVYRGEIRSGWDHFVASGQAEGRLQLRQPQAFTHYEPRPPADSNSFDLFAGRWSSYLPGHGYGEAYTFTDPRITWFLEQYGDIRGRSVLELGPMEAGHTYMLAEAGANVLALEANTGAFLRCLIVKEAYGIKARFMLGDFMPYMATTDAHFDAAVASGVLYHMEDPVTFLEELMRVTDTFLIWSHYFDRDIIQARTDISHKFATSPEFVTHKGRRVELWKQKYLGALDWGGFCGGPEETSNWLTREGMLGVIEDGGFDVTVGVDEPLHVNGPAILFMARRRATT